MASRRGNPRLTAYRVLMRQGNSLVVAPPPEFLRALSLVKGDYVLIEMVPGDTVVTLKKDPHERSRRGAPSPAQPTLKEVL